MRTGTAHLPLHGGKAPRYLFERMVKLGREISTAIVEEYGTLELMRKLADPFWFQAFGCVLGYDWHSSGVTTVVCGAVKEAWKPISKDMGLFIAGGKGATSRKTPSEIESLAPELQIPPSGLVYASRMSAKVDNNALQDGYQIYHHSFIFDRTGRWGVIQQGMNQENGWARRYHWLSESVANFVDEPHAGIISAATTKPLNLVAHESDSARQASVTLALEKPWKNLTELKKLQRLELPKHHEVLMKDINPDRIASTLLSAYEGQPQNFEQLLGTPNVGPKTIRALALLSEVIHGAKASFRDPARFSFAHGGKDGHPYPVDRETYDLSIHVLKNAVQRAKVGERDRLDAIKRLNILIQEDNA
ncbi:MAG: DUF763 domain-containing protein [Chloroflexi bacterium]|nr:MAG: DUF763 domain-containing protein [Chloroflexota bacterium]